MEGLTRLVTESLARHGFDRPLDYRRLHWSRWFRCDSPHSLLFVPSKPGVFAVAEEIIDLGSNVEARAKANSEARVEERRFSAASGSPSIAALAAEAISPDAESRKPAALFPRRMLAVTQFFEDDDMAFVLDRMLSRRNPMFDRLASGRYFVRFVVVEDPTQRRSICNALNQWMVSSAEKATGIGSHFATSLELTPATEYIPQPDDRQQSLFAAATAEREAQPNREGHDFSRAARTAQISPALAAEGIISAARTQPEKSITQTRTPTSPQLDSGAATNLHCPTPIPSGF
jgi:hypothetical protein